MKINDLSIDAYAVQDAKHARSGRIDVHRSSDITVLVDERTAIDDKVRSRAEGRRNFVGRLQLVARPACLLLDVALAPRRSWVDPLACRDRSESTEKVYRDDYDLRQRTAKANRRLHL